MSGAQARVRFDLPSGTDAAEKVTRSTNTDRKETTQYERNDECPDDVRAAVYDALKAAFGETLDVWALLPRKVAHGPRHVSVTLVPVTVVYLDEQEQTVADGPRQRLLATLDEYQQERQANMVAVQVLVAETEGDEATLHEELDRLERQGEVYQPEVGHYRRTGA